VKTLVYIVFVVNFLSIKSLYIFAQDYPYVELLVGNRITDNIPDKNLYLKFYPVGSVFSGWLNGIPPNGDKTYYSLRALHQHSRNGTEYDPPLRS